MSEQLQQEILKTANALHSWALRANVSAMAIAEDFSKLAERVELLSLEIGKALRAKEIMKARQWSVHSVVLHGELIFLVDATDMGHGGYSSKSKGGALTFARWVKLRHSTCPFHALVDAEDLYVYCTTKPEEAKRSYELEVECCAMPEKT